MIRFGLIMRFTPGTFDGTLGVLRSLLGPIRSEPGCLATKLMMSADGDHTLSWVEEWHGLEAFAGHLEARTFRQLLAVIEIAAVPPVVQIDDVSSRRGFELVEEMLAESGRERAVPKRRRS